MEWTFKQGPPIYTQIAEQMRINIASGLFEPGEKLPSVREMSMEASVNPNTMQRALSNLEGEGLLYTERTSGRYITKEETILNDLKRTLGKHFINDMFENLRKLGMTKEEIVKMINEWAEEESNELTGM